MDTILILLAVNLLLGILGLVLFRENRVKRNLRKSEILDFILFSLLLLLIALVHLTEVKIDSFATSELGVDYTRLVYNMGGNEVALFQSQPNTFLDYYMVFMYIFGFSFIMYFPPTLYVFSKDLKSLKLVVISYGIMVAVAVPFYLFFPVYDVWWASQHYPWYHGKAVAFRLNQIWPEITTTFFSFTTLNNCFPSLHNGISAAMAAIAWIRKYKRFKIAATVIALSIPVATLYLGIHWFADIISGELLALAAVVISVKVVERT